VDKIVGKLKMLEIFVARAIPGIRNSTIKVLTQEKLNLKVGSFSEYCQLFEIQAMTDEWDLDVLVEFGKMLLSNDPKTLASRSGAQESGISVMLMTLA